MRSSEFITDAKVKLKGFNTQAQRERALDFIDAVYAKFPENWSFSPDHHTMILDTNEEGKPTAIASFELLPSKVKPGAVDIDWFQAVPQGQGNGRRAMAILQQMAQEAGVELTIYPSKKHRMSQSELKAIYKKLGFAPIKGGDNMLWEPSINEAFTLELTKKTPEVRMFTVLFNGNTVGQAMRFKDGTVKLQMGNHPVVTVKAASVLDAVNDWAAKIR